MVYSLEKTSTFD